MRERFRNRETHTDTNREAERKREYDWILTLLNLVQLKSYDKDIHIHGRYYVTLFSYPDYTLTKTNAYTPPNAGFTNSSPLTI